MGQEVDCSPGQHNTETKRTYNHADTNVQLHKFMLFCLPILYCSMPESHIHHKKHS